MTTPGAPSPLVFIVSGPSGSGKSTLVKKILEVPGTMFSISCTTRPPRATETPGRWYDFVSEAEFDRRARQGEFLEHARVFSQHRYGTPRRWVEEARRTGLDLVLEIDVQGAEQVKRELTSAVSIFILPPSRAELERRLRSRGLDSNEEIGRRLDRAGDPALRGIRLPGRQRRSGTGRARNPGHCARGAVPPQPHGRLRS
jgi:guanylate kinase